MGNGYDGYNVFQMGKLRSRGPERLSDLSKMLEVGLEVEVGCLIVFFFFKTVYHTFLFDPPYMLKYDFKWVAP